MKIKQVRLTLTEEQKTVLHDFFREARMADATGKKIMILAQLRENLDSVVYLIPHEPSKYIQAVAGVANGWEASEFMEKKIYINP